MDFTCPYCNRPTTITSPNYDENWRSINIDDKRLEQSSHVGFGYYVVACPNRDCKKMFLRARLTEAERIGYSSNYEEGGGLQEWQLLPESGAKPQPAYIPKPIIDDYNEACRIRDLSPKAAATLARRCMQGMIRDFHGIKKGTLGEEIDELQGKIPTAEWEAIDALRKIGNIGAHMEKDVNLIVDIDPEEANRLIAFIEYLFQQWYVKRHDDQTNLAEIKRIAGLKAASKKTPNPKTGKP